MPTEDQKLPPGTLARITVPGRTAALVPLQALTVEFARGLGFEGKVLDDIRLIIEEAYTGTLHSAFEPGEQGEITLLLERLPGALVMSFEDHGLPADLRELEESEALYLNFRLLRGLSDGLSFINQGQGGKRLELWKNLPAVQLDTPWMQEPSPQEFQAPEDPTESGEPEFRFISPDETLALAQLAWRTYGYTYVSDFYYPEKTRELIERGLMKSCVAVLPSGRMIGSLSLFYKTPDARVAESGAAMVEPRYRGLNLFKRLKQFLFDHGRETGLYGISSESVTIHPYTQQGNLTLGATETGILLAYTTHVAFKKIENTLSGERQAMVYFYARLNPEPHRKVYAPLCYLANAQQIHARANLAREVLPAESGAPLPGAPTQLNIAVRSEIFNDATLTLHQMGADAHETVMHHTRKLCEGKIDVVYLDLPMADEAAMILADRLREDGYLFACIAPEQPQGDVLRLQYLNNVAFDIREVVLISDHAKALMNFINQQYIELREQ